MARASDGRVDERAEHDLTLRRTLPASAVIGVTQAAVLAHRTPRALAGSEPGLALIMLVVHALLDSR